MRPVGALGLTASALLAILVSPATPFASVALASATPDGAMGDAGALPGVEGHAVPSPPANQTPESATTGHAILLADPPDAAAAAAQGTSAERAPGRWPRTCSLRFPICVHAPEGSDPRGALAVLGAAERAWAALFEALAMPAPDLDPDGAWHVYLASDVTGGGDALVESRDPLARFDRARTFGLVERSLAPGCALDLAATRALARAAIDGVAPATDEGTARAEAETLSRLAVPCAIGDGDLLDFQSHPERTLVDPESPAGGRGAALFFDWLDGTFARQPGALVRGLLALSPTRTPAGATRWASRPTAYDVLRVSLHGAFGVDSNLDDVFARFAVARAEASPPPELAWHVAWPKAARRLASPEPVSPTGASYVLVDHEGAAPGSRLRVEAQWEDYGRMRWLAVKRGTGGAATAVVPINSLDRGTRASMTIEALDGVDQVLLVGVNVGSTEHPFDPNQGEWEPHGWLLTVASE